jgi:hypothetical protein
LFPGWDPNTGFSGDPGDRDAEAAETTRLAAEHAKKSAGMPPRVEKEEERRKSTQFKNFMDRERVEREELHRDEKDRQEKLRTGETGGVGSYYESDQEEAKRKQELPFTANEGWEDRLGEAIGKSMQVKKKKKGRGGGGGGGGDSSSDSDLLHSSDDESRYKGAKGAAAYEDEKLRAERHGTRRYQDLRRLLRLFLGVREGQAHRAVDAIPRLPCGTFVTLKRALYVLFELLDYEEAEDWARVKGLTAQAIRWLILQLFVPQRPDLAWRMTFLPDPLMIQCVRASDSPDLIDGALQDPRQITACLGLAKDLQTILEKTRGGQRRQWYGGGGGQQQQQQAPGQPQQQQQHQVAGGAGRGRRGRGARGGNPNPDTAGGPAVAPGDHP